jgi:hypothetical protein
MPIKKAVAAGIHFKSKSGMERFLLLYFKERWGRFLIEEEADFVTTLIKYPSTKTKNALNNMTGVFVCKKGASSSTLIIKTPEGNVEVPWRKEMGVRNA